jgi:uncharacterized protein YciI
MLFVVHALDRADGRRERSRNFRAHRAHLDGAGRTGVEVVSAGSMVADDGETPIGSLLVLEAPDRAAVEAFCRADPYQANGVWERVDVRAFVKRRGWASPASTGI